MEGRDQMYQSITCVGTLLLQIGEVGQRVKGDFIFALQRSFFLNPLYFFVFIIVYKCEYINTICCCLFFIGHFHWPLLNVQGIVLPKLCYLYIKSDATYFVVKIKCHCDFIMNFLSSSYFIFQISHVKIFEISCILDVCLSSLNKVIDKIA
jgi:hypothetical protein